MLLHILKNLKLQAFFIYINQLNLGNCKVNYCLDMKLIMIL
ncbi:hypothetical protein pb186bvf_009823 [Paramecium bursaria]